VPTLVGAPRRAAGVQLLGEVEGSGYRTPPALVRRSDGQTLQLTPLLYQLLEAIDGRRDHAEIAEDVGRSSGRHVTSEQVRMLVDDRLRPLGLIQQADGTDPVLRRSDPLLGLALKFKITNPRTTHRLTDPFRFLFRPAVVPVIVVGFLAVTWWVFFERGLAASAYDAFERPQLLLLVFVVTVLSAGFHEFGHAAAARYGGAEPGVMGAGLYLVWPAFYTDVTDSYRLGRTGRVRTDLGGLYFNALVVVLTFAWWYYSGWEALLLLVATQIMQMTQQLLPLLRFDGYHVLADLAGVPDLYHRMRPTLRGLLPDRWSHPDNRILKPWSRMVITAWVLVTIPMMALMLVAVVMATPRLIATAVSVVREDVTGFGEAWGSGGFIDGSAHLLQVLGVVLPSVACVLILGRVGWRWLTSLSVWSRGSLGRRAAAAVLSAVVVTGVSWAWWPDPGTYRPIAPDEEGTLSALVPDQQYILTVSDAAVPPLPAPTAVEARLSQDEPLQATFPSESAVPTRDDPQLAMVLVPQGGAAGGGPVDGPTDAPTGLPSDDTIDPWVFPFNQPLPPEDGDNQALAINTTDDSVVYDVAFALVWAEDDEVLNVNEAHAYASCSRCVTVAVAFQVVLIVDDASVVVPQNLAVAANYECFACITVALASQLVLSVDGPPDQQELLSLQTLWNELLQFGHNIASYSLDEITSQLDDFQAQIMNILGVAAATPGPSTAPPTVVGTTTPPTTAAPTDTATTTDPTPSDVPTAPPTPSAPSTTDTTPTPSATSTTASPTPTPSSSASATPTDTPSSAVP
jgi:putative peptide zinc metalloprotease protein